MFFHCGSHKTVSIEVLFVLSIYNFVETFVCICMPFLFSSVLIICVLNHLYVCLSIYPKQKIFPDITQSGISNTCCMHSLCAVDERKSMEIPQWIIDIMTEENNCLYTANRDNLTVHSTPRTMAMAMQANEWASLCLTRGSEDSFTSSLGYWRWFCELY